MDLFIDAQFLLILLSGIFTALAASFLGVFVVVKRMALASDVLSHVALPGMGLALLLNYDPMLGAAVFLVLAALFLVFGLFIDFSRFFTKYSVLDWSNLIAISCNVFSRYFIFISKENICFERFAIAIHNCALLGSFDFE